MPFAASEGRKVKTSGRQSRALIADADRVQSWANCHHALKTRVLMLGIQPSDTNPTNQHIHTNDKRVISNERVNEQQGEEEG